jgi:glutathione S-transferase
MAMTLYELGGKKNFRYCPFCWRSLMALKHKGFDDFDRISVYYRDRTPIAFTDQDRVPVLVDGDHWVSDSWDIAKYLEDTYPGRPTLFGDPVGRANAQFISAWVLQLHKPFLTAILMWDAYQHLDPADRSWWRADREARFGKLENYKHGREESILEWRKLLSPFRVTLSEQPFLGGHAPAYADYIVFGSFQWARCVSKLELLETDDPIFIWRDRLLDLFDGFARAAPHASA